MLRSKIKFQNMGDEEVSVQLIWKDKLGETKELYILRCLAGEEIFEGSPVSHQAHIMISRLPTFDTSVSFQSIKSEGIILYFTPSRDGKKIQGSLWQHLYDKTNIPNILKKSEVFDDYETINTIDKLNKIAENFHQSTAQDDFIDAVARVEKIISLSQKKTAQDKIKIFKIELVKEFELRIKVLNENCDFLVRNRLTLKERQDFDEDIVKIQKAYTNVIEFLSK